MGNCEECRGSLAQAHFLTFSSVKGMLPTKYTNVHKIKTCSLCFFRGILCVSWATVLGTELAQDKRCRVVQIQAFAFGNAVFNSDKVIIEFSDVHQPFFRAALLHDITHVIAGLFENGL